MGKRTPALSRRILSLVNWPSTVRHTFLSQYIKHVFQSHIICEPGIRASTSGIWINVTVLSPQFHPIHGSTPKNKVYKTTAVVNSSEDTIETKPDVILSETGEMPIAEPIVRTKIVHGEEYSLSGHPLFQKPILNFHNVQLVNALGPIDARIRLMMDGTDPERKKKDLREGHFYFKPLSEGSAKSLMEAKDCVEDPLKALQIYSDKPIHLRINVVENPLMNAQILADFIARSLKENDRALPKIFKQLIANC